MTSTFNDIIDGVSTSLAVKAPVRVVSTTHLALYGLVVVEGVQTTEDMRILVNAQNDAVDNGIYTAETGAWRRTKDFDGARDAAYGTTVFSAENSKFYRLITPNPVVIGTDDIHWVVTILSEEAGEMQVVDNVADLRLTIAAVDGQTIGLAGYYEPGDAPFRTVWWDAASTATDDGGRVFQVTGVATGRWKSSIVDHMDIRLWGAKLDDATDDYDAWDRALNSALRTEPLLFDAKYAGAFIFPEGGKSYVSQTLQCKALFSLHGSSSHINNYNACAIRSPANTTAIQINVYNTLGDLTVANGSSASGSVIDGISFEGPYYPTPTGTTGHGIHLRGNAIIRNVNVRGYAENGVHIDASCGVGGSHEGNANNFYLENVRAQQCNHGFYITGTCANAGTIIRCDGSHNRGWGFFDESFLGNTYIGLHTQQNTLGPFKTTNNNAQNIFINPYSEADQPEAEYVYPTLVLGGLSGAGVTAASTAVILINALAQLRNNKGFESLMESAGVTVTATLGGNPSNGNILTGYHETYAPLLHRLHYSDEDLDFDYANVVGSLGWRMTGPSTVATFGQSAPVPNALMVPKLYVGSISEASCRRITTQTFPPSSGEWARGDTIFHISAAAAGDPGGMCTTSGTAGSTAVFKAFANLDS